jgi:hypothetical protein
MEIKYDPNLKPGKCSVCGLPLIFLPELFNINEHFSICSRCVYNNDVLQKVKINNVILYNEILDRRISAENSKEIKLSQNLNDGWIEIRGHKLYHGSPKWLTDIPIDKLRIKAKEYEKPKKPEPIMINNIPIHENQSIELLNGEFF